MIELIVVRTDGSYLLPVQRLECRGERWKAPRSINVDVFSTERGLHQKTLVDVGNTVIFRWNGAERFRGTVFSMDQSSEGTLTLTAYDQLIYLTKNSDTYVFSGRTASEILAQICSDFQIQIGQIADTRYRMTRSFEGKTLFDIILTALHLTYLQTGVQYALYDQEGKLNLAKRAEIAQKWVVEDGANLMSFSYGRSIEDTVTRVKLKAGEEKKTIIAKIDSPELQKKFGVLQHYEKVAEDLNKAQLLKRAEQIIQQKGKINESFSLEALGIPDVISGSAIYVVNQELGIQSAFYVEADSHSYEGKDHRMSLTLTKTDDLPEIDVAEKEQKKGKKDEDKEFAEQLRKEILGE